MHINEWRLAGLPSTEGSNRFATANNRSSSYISKIVKLKHTFIPIRGPTQSTSSLFKKKKNTHPVNFNCPPLIPTLKSLSRGDPNGINCSSFLSLNSRFVVSSNLRVMCSTASGVPYFEFFNFSGCNSNLNFKKTMKGKRIYLLRIP